MPVDSPEVASGRIRKALLYVMYIYLAYLIVLIGVMLVRPLCSGPRFWYIAMSWFRWTAMELGKAGIACEHAYYESLEATRLS